VHVFFACSAVPGTGNAAVGVSSTGHDVATIALGFGGFAWRGCISDDIHAHCFGYMGDWEELETESSNIVYKKATSIP
jgi:hypothetical protein